MKSVLQELWRDKLDVLFPRSCVHCGGVVEGGRLRHLCPACERMLFIVQASALHHLRSGLANFGRSSEPVHTHGGRREEISGAIGPEDDMEPGAWAIFNSGMTPSE